MMDKLEFKELHEQLVEEFQELKNVRECYPVYLLEHKFGPETLRRIRNYLTRVSWSGLREIKLQYPLPLMVIAAEVGYRYRGTGTEYWPLLRNEIPSEHFTEIRSTIPIVFEKQANLIGTARRGNSPWEEHFPHISWPIANAIVPLEFHRNIASLIRQATRRGVKLEEESKFIDEIRMLASSQETGRVKYWVNHHEASMPVCKYLLVGKEMENWLSPHVLERIATDLSQDFIAKRTLREAQHLRTRKKQQSKLPKSSIYRIKFEEGKPQRLEIAGPVLNIEDRVEVITTLDLPNDKLLLPEMGEEVDLHSFLAGGVSDYGKLRKLPYDPLKSEEINSKNGNSKKVLDALQPNFDPIFRYDEQIGMAYGNNRGTKYNPSFKYFELRINAEKNSKPELFWLNIDEHRQIFDERDIRISTEKEILPFWGLPMSAENEVFADSFPILIQTESEEETVSPDEFEKFVVCESKLNGNLYKVLNPGICNFTVELKGKHNRSREGNLIVAERPNLPAATITIDPQNPSIEDMVSGNFTIFVSSPLQIENRIITFSFENQLFDVRVDRLPFRFSGNSKKLEEFRKNLSTFIHESGRNPEILITASGLRGVIVSPHIMDRRLVPDFDKKCWYNEEDTDAEPVTNSELATLENPILTKYEGDWKFKEAGILVPNSNHFDDVFFANGVGQSKSLTLAVSPFVEPQVIRQPKTQSSGIGLIDVARSISAWQSARFGNPIMEKQRSNSVDRLEKLAVKQLCGEKWQELEQSLEHLGKSEFSYFILEANKAKLLSDGDYIKQITAEEKISLQLHIQEQLSQEITNLYHTLSCWDEKIGEDFDEALLRAYESHSNEIVQKSDRQLEEPDIGWDPEFWRQCIRSAIKSSRMEQFKTLILPDDRWQKLSKANYRSLGEEDVIDLLEVCHLDARRRPGQRWIEKNDLRIHLKFWHNPKSLQNDEDWLDRLPRFLSDGQTARAVRYASLRLRSAQSEFTDWEFT